MKHYQLIWINLEVIKKRVLEKYTERKAQGVCLYQLECPSFLFFSVSFKYKYTY